MATWHLGFVKHYTGLVFCVNLSIEQTLHIYLLGAESTGWGRFSLFSPVVPFKAQRDDFCGCKIHMG